MIYNDKLPSEYGNPSELSTFFPVAIKPILTEKDYSAGSITRWFAKKPNELRAIEITSEQSLKINNMLYGLTSLRWRITGYKNDKIVNGIIESMGVEKENKGEIDRVLRENGIDLRQTLTDPLEYWRGY